MKVGTYLLVWLSKAFVKEWEPHLIPLQWGTERPREHFVLLRGGGTAPTAQVAGSLSWPRKLPAFKHPHRLSWCLKCRKQITECRKYVSTCQHPGTQLRNLWRFPFRSVTGKVLILIRELKQSHPPPRPLGPSRPLLSPQQAPRSFYDPRQWQKNATSCPSFPVADA